ncbi:unnamed protein product [Rotaria sp. Silwood2]|nr:unnamed protein product [Rotaria sp. Silwood2]CAF4363979.1 unnamed protein product [Rotaria sp. Silwood2]
MENTDVSVQQDETTPVVEQVTEETSKTIDEQPVSEHTSKSDVEPSTSEDTPTTNDEPVVTEDTTKTNDEQQTNEEPPVTTTEEATPMLENKEEKVVLLSPPTEEDKMIPTDEQENATDTNPSASTASVSPNRTNVPLKEVNESEKEESIVLTNGTDNTISKKRELEQEDDKPDGTNDSEERTGDQTKKIKISESTDTPIIDSKETENIMVNGNTAVEVGINM